jgi:AAA domain, putative AbiEii toxin, Type IV TA system
VRITGICVTNVPPIVYFDADDLSNRVVVAGANGVGKTRLKQQLLTIVQNMSPNPTSYVTVEATSDEEKSAWGNGTISTKDSDGCQKLRAIIQANRRRNKLKSSVVHIESNRSFFQPQNFGFSFDFPDPDEDELGWNHMYQPLASRWQETQNAIFKKVLATRNGLGSKAMQLREEGKSSMSLHFDDPLNPYAEAFLSLLAPKTLAKPDLAGQRLRYNFGSGELYLDELSSGEIEVVRITFDILLRSPNDCVFVIDEPELHLHPELLQRLVRTLEKIGTNNQFIFFSHSPDIISSSIDDTVIFMRPPKEKENQAVRATRNEDAVEGLRLLGQSIGVIALGKKVVVIEGTNSSVDKKTYSSVLGEKFNDFVLLPSGGVGTLTRFESLRKSILDQSLWGVDFFMLRDGDAQSALVEEETDKQSRLRRLPRYHIENYFLEPTLVARVFADLGCPDSGFCQSESIKKLIEDLALDHVGYAVALIVERYINVKPGMTNLIPAHSNAMDARTLSSEMCKLAQEYKEKMHRILSDEDITKITNEWHSRIASSIKAGSNEWHQWIPGKPVVKKLINLAGVKDWTFKTKYLQLSSQGDHVAFSEIKNIFGDFSEIASGATG